MTNAYAPHGAALIDYERGIADATLICEQDGERDDVPAAFWFRTEIDPLEAAALDLCRGRVLDVGGGAGVHALLLQASGHAVTSIDVDAAAVEITRRRGVRNARQADLNSLALQLAHTLEAQRVQERQSEASVTAQHGLRDERGYIARWSFRPAPSTQTRTDRVVFRF